MKYLPSSNKWSHQSTNRHENASIAPLTLQKEPAPKFPVGYYFLDLLQKEQCMFIKNRVAFSSSSSAAHNTPKHNRGLLPAIDVEKTFGRAIWKFAFSGLINLEFGSHLPEMDDSGLLNK